MIYVKLDGDVVKSAQQFQSVDQVPPDGLTVILRGTPGPGEILAPRRVTIYDLNKMYVVGGVLVDRPELTAPVQSGSTITLSGLPLGTLIEVIDVSGDEVMTELVSDTEDWGDDIVMASNGVYQIELLPPAPYLELSFAFEVTGL